MIPIPAEDLAALCWAIYSTDSSWEHRSEAGGVVVGHKRLGGTVDVLVFRGSLTLEDWFRDFHAVPLKHPVLGHVHAGFADGIDAALEAVQPWLGQWVVLTGHSLGAAHAWLMGGLLAAQKRPPWQITVFGSPRPGFADVAALVRDCGSVNASYRNRLDPVTEVPALLGLYEHPAPLTQLYGMPGKLDLSVLRDHHIDRYVAGLVDLKAAA